MKGNRDRVRYRVIKCIGMYYIFMNTYTASSLLLIYNRLEHVQGLGCNHLEAGRLVLWARQKLNEVV